MESPKRTEQGNVEEQASEQAMLESDATNLTPAEMQAKDPSVLKQTLSKGTMWVQGNVKRYLQTRPSGMSSLKEGPVSERQQQEVPAAKGAESPFCDDSDELGELEEDSPAKPATPRGGPKRLLMGSLNALGQLRVQTKKVNRQEDDRRIRWTRSMPSKGARGDAETSQRESMERTEGERVNESHSLDNSAPSGEDLSLGGTGDKERPSSESVGEGVREKTVSSSSQASDELVEAVSASLRGGMRRQQPAWSQRKALLLEQLQDVLSLFQGASSASSGEAEGDGEGLASGNRSQQKPTVEPSPWRPMPFKPFRVQPKAAQQQQGQDKGGELQAPSTHDGSGAEGAGADEGVDEADLPAGELEEVLVQLLSQCVDRAREEGNLLEKNLPELKQKRPEEAEDCSPAILSGAGIQDGTGPGVIRSEGEEAASPNLSILQQEQQLRDFKKAARLLAVPRMLPARLAQQLKLLVDAVQAQSGQAAHRFSSKETGSQAAIGEESKASRVASSASSASLSGGGGGVGGEDSGLGKCGEASALPRGKSLHEQLKDVVRMLSSLSSQSSQGASAGTQDMDAGGEGSTSKSQPELEVPKGRALQPAKVYGQVKQLLAALQLQKNVGSTNNSTSNTVTTEGLTGLSLTGSTFTEAQLEKATQGFSESKLVGQGAFGAVYRGEVHGTPVAVKRLFKSSLEGSGFGTELDVLTRIRHPNIVLLMGFCSTGQRPCLVYEFLSGGNLQQRLEMKDGFEPLSWAHRLRIACELSSALLFLHSQEVPILHRDLKPENVMLDEDGRCKVVDVGMARMNGDSMVCTKVVVGTVGYIDPELMMTGRVTRASDVYAFGLILLQLLTGVMGRTELYDLVNLVRGRGAKKPAPGEDCVEEEAEEEGSSGPAAAEEEGSSGPSEGRLLEAADLVVQRLDPNAGDWPVDVARKAAYVALRCSWADAAHRPKIGMVHSVLSGLRQAGGSKA